MQVKELNPETTSIWQFFTLNAGLISTSYIVVFFQSTYFKRLLLRHRDEIRRFAEVRREALLLSNDDRLNPGWVMQYLWEERFAWIANAGSLLIIIVPLISIWTSSLVRSIKLIVSISVLLASLVMLVGGNINTIQRRLAQNVPDYDELADEEEQRM